MRTTEKTLQTAVGRINALLPRSRGRYQLDHHAGGYRLELLPAGGGTTWSSDRYTANEMSCYLAGMEHVLLNFYVS